MKFSICFYPGENEKNQTRSNITDFTVTYLRPLSRYGNSENLRGKRIKQNKQKLKMCDFLSIENSLLKLIYEDKWK